MGLTLTTSWNATSKGRGRDAVKGIMSELECSGRTVWPKPFLPVCPSTLALRDPWELN